MDLDALRAEVQRCTLAEAAVNREVNKLVRDGLVPPELVSRVDAATAELSRARQALARAQARAELQEAQAAFDAVVDADK